MLSKRIRNEVKEMVDHEIQWGQSMAWPHTEKDYRLIGRGLRDRVNSKIADRYASESLLGSLLMGLAMRLAWKLIQNWVDEKIKELT